MRTLLKIFTAIVAINGIKALDVSTESRSFLGACITREKYKSLGCVIKSVVSSSQISCAQLCIMHPGCISTNYRSSSGLCELNNCGFRETVPRKGAVMKYREAFVYSEYNREDCQLSGCRNGGTCVFNQKSKRQFHCMCESMWTGEFCQELQKGYDADLVLRFTNLGSTGRNGPSNSAAYKGTPLEKVQITNGLQEWTVPITGQYKLEVCGAAGGDAQLGASGGKGAQISGEIRLTKGIILRILIGQKGQPGSYGGSGGGGTFIVHNNSTPLAIAGGGGGGGSKPGEPGQPGKNGSVFGGMNGAGGIVRPEQVMYRKFPDGGSGGGFLQDGCCYSRARCYSCGNGGRAFKSGGDGGRSCSSCDGGFGGGGASDTYAGGGGGFSGGGATEYNGGGGGSFKVNETWTITEGSCVGDGYAIFRYTDQE